MGRVYGFTPDAGAAFQQTMKAGHVSHWRRLRRKRGGAEKKKNHWMDLPASWITAHVESQFVMINRHTLSFSLCVSIHRPLHSQRLRWDTLLQGVCVDSIFSCPLSAFIFQISWGVRSKSIWWPVASCNTFVRPSTGGWPTILHQKPQCTALLFYVCLFNLYIIPHRVISASTGCITWFSEESKPCHMAVYVFVQFIYRQHCCWLVHVMPKPMTLAIMSNREANHLLQTLLFSWVCGMEMEKAEIWFLPLTNPWRLWILHWFELSPSRSTGSFSPHRPL